MSAVTRLLARVRGWLDRRRTADPFASDPASGEFLAAISEPAPLERVRGLAAMRIVAGRGRWPRPVRRLPR